MEASRRRDSSETSSHCLYLPRDTEMREVFSDWTEWIETVSAGESPSLHAINQQTALVSLTRLRRRSGLPLVDNELLEEGLEPMERSLLSDVSSERPLPDPSQVLLQRSGTEGPHAMRAENGPGGREEVRPAGHVTNMLTPSQGWFRNRWELWLGELGGFLILGGLPTTRDIQYDRLQS